MLSPLTIFVALTIFLCTPTSSASPIYHPREHHKDFTIALQRYKDHACRKPFGHWRWQIDQRVEIHDPKYGSKCKSFKEGHGLGSYDFKWMPRGHYEADTAQDDPRKGPKGKGRFCYVRVFEEEKCQGRVLHTLSEANEWRNVESCMMWEEGMARSVMLHCEVH